MIWDSLTASLRTFFSNLKYVFFPDKTELLTDARAAVEEAFRHLQIDWKRTEREQNEHETDYQFTFQNGRFLATVSSDEPYVRFHFPFFCEEPFDGLDNLRYACNEFNLQPHGFKVTYTIIEKTHTLHTHLLFSFRLSLSGRRQTREMAELFSECFERARAFRAMLGDIKGNHEQDVEEATAMNARERYLSREAELAEAEGMPRWRDTQDRTHTLGEIFRTFFEPQTDVRYLNLQGMLVENDSDEPTANETFRTTDAAAIADFPLLEQLVFVADDTSTAQRPEALTLVVNAALNGNRPQSFVLHIVRESETEDSLYFRVSFACMSSEIAPYHSLTVTHMGTDNLIATFVMAYDRTDESRRMAEFNYRRQEALDAAARGEELTEEQQFIEFCLTPGVGYNMYWGRRLFLEKRYFEALRHLNNAYEALNDRFSQLDKKGRDSFFELAYYIGFCYTELHLYRQAYFYLDSIYPLNSVRYTTEYVNALVNSRDFRAIAVIDRLLHGLDKEMKDEDITEVQQQYFRSFVRFLKRRKGNALVYSGQLDEAEQIFKALLNEPDSEDVALKELLRIQKLRGEAQTSANKDLS